MKTENEFKFDTQTAICIFLAGWRNDDEKELYDLAYIKLRAVADMAKLEFKKAKLDEQIKKAKAKTNEYRK